MWTHYNVISPFTKVSYKMRELIHYIVDQRQTSLWHLFRSQLYFVIKFHYNQSGHFSVTYEWTDIFVKSKWSVERGERKTHPGSPPASIMLASVTSLDQTSYCHLRRPSTPQSTRPVWIPTLIFNCTSVASTTDLQYTVIFSRFDTVNLSIYIIAFTMLTCIIPNHITHLKLFLTSHKPLLSEGFHKIIKPQWFNRTSSDSSREVLNTIVNNKIKALQWITPVLMSYKNHQYNSLLIQILPCFPTTRAP